MEPLKIFPASLIDGQKVPLIKGWNESATSDKNQINQWCNIFKDRISFFGLPCGPVNNIMVLDVDVKSTNGFNTIKEMDLNIPNTLRQDTPSGGSHYIFKFNPNRDPGNKVNFLPGLDIRSTKGWIAFYKFVNNEPILDAPDWIYDLATKQKPVPTNQEVSLVRVQPEIAKNIFDTAIRNILNAAEGEGNNILNIESFKIGQLVNSGAINREYAETELFKAAKIRGRSDYEARATIASGLSGGSNKPITNPFGEAKPIATFQLPPPPEAPKPWLPRLMTREDLLNTSKLRRPQLFKDWNTRDIRLITADGGLGKTTLCLYEAICLALGDRFLSMDCIGPGKTLYITGEDSAEKIMAMLGAILKQMGLMNDHPENNEKVNKVLSSILVKKDSDLCLITKEKFTGFLKINEDIKTKILEAVESFKPDQIIFDPIAAFWGSESSLNDMALTVMKFMSEIVEVGKCGVTLINHMGKASSAAKDISQFAGRGGSGLPSHSRISKVLQSLPEEEYQKMCGSEIPEGKTAFLCVVNKFSDGSPLLSKPFVIIRDKYLFSKIDLSPQQVRDHEKKMQDEERIFNYIAEQRRLNKYPSEAVVIGYHMNNGDPMSKDRIKRAINMLAFDGWMGQKIQFIDNLDLTKKEKVLVITDLNGKET